MSKNSKLKRELKKRLKINKNNVTRDIQMREKNKTPHIYFDESGNTGSNLLDNNQPVFTLASCKFTTKESERLLELVGSKSPTEAHFKNLRRRKSGQDGIIRLMSDKIINIRNIKVNIFLKEFMITTKIVDILIEHMMHLAGKDLYINGRNIALSNMLYYCLPVFCDEKLVRDMYESFVSMIRTQSEEDITRFYSDVENLKRSCREKSFERNINLILDTKLCVHDALNGIDKNALDPSIPALFSQCVRWGDEYSKGFHIVHDNSHCIEKQTLLFSLFMDWTQNETTYGYDRRKFNLPLKGKSLKFANSEEYTQIQVADIIASSFSYWAAGVSRGETEDYLFLELNKLNLDRFIGHNKIWPTMDFTPEELGTIHDGGINAADHIPSFLKNAIPNSKIHHRLHLKAEVDKL